MNSGIINNCNSQDIQQLLNSNEIITTIGTFNVNYVNETSGSTPSFGFNAVSVLVANNRCLNNILSTQYYLTSTDMIGAPQVTNVSFNFISTDPITNKKVGEIYGINSFIKNDNEHIRRYNIISKNGIYDDVVGIIINTKLPLRVIYYITIDPYNSHSV
jgi:hypothetical protein